MLSGTAQPLFKRIKFEDLLDAAPDHKRRLLLFELLVRILRCLTCFLAHAETTSSRFRLMEPRPFALETVVEVLGQDFTMMFESVQYVQSVKEKLNTTGVGALHGWDGDRGRLNYLDEEEDNGSLMSRASFGEDHGFHDNEYADPHTMVEFSYAPSTNVLASSLSSAAAAAAPSSSMSNNASNNDRSQQRLSVTFSDQEPQPRGNGNEGKVCGITERAGPNDPTLNMSDMSGASLNLTVFAGGELGN